MRVTAGAAGSLGSLLVSAREGASTEVSEWVASVRGMPLRDVAHEIAERIIPVGGSLDEEAAKNAVCEGISKLHEDHPGLDIFALTDDQVYELMGNVIGYDVYHRIHLEMGRRFERLRYKATQVRERLNELREYLLAVVAAEVSKLKGRGISRATMVSVARTALQKSWAVYGNE